MNESKVYIIGTRHSSKSSKKVIKDAIEKHGFDVILMEGVDEIHEFRYKMLIKEPLLMIILPIYSYILKKLGSEFDMATKIAKDEGILLKSVNFPLDLLIGEFHRWYNYIFQCIIFLFFPIFLHGAFIRAIIIFLFLLVIYYDCFVVKTMKCRNEILIEKTVEIIKEGNNRKILIICGKNHVRALEEKMPLIDLTLEDFDKRLVLSG